MPVTQTSRRLTLKLAAASLATPAAFAFARPTTLTTAPVSVVNAVASFAALEPATTNCLVEVASAKQNWSAGHQPARQLFVGSAVKTFILAQFLRDVETARNGLAASQPAVVSDAMRSPGSPVFLGLTGTTPYRSVLEAMITHSDNTATDIALAKAEPLRVRALIAEAGLQQTRIPDSTRKLFSYLSGAPGGVDLGWDGMERLSKGETLGLTARTSVINDTQTMLSSAADMVHWYRQSLSGKFFQKPATLTEYKRIQAMADAIARTVPPGIAAFGKGGSIDWEGFHCLCFPGQMVVGNTAATFCFTLNWTGDVHSDRRADAFIAAAAKVLAEVSKAVLLKA